MSIPSLLAVLALGLPAAPASMQDAAAAPGVDLVALRAFFKEEAYAPGDKATLVLARESRGGEAVFRNVLVQVSVLGEGTPRRLKFRLKEAPVPQGERHFHMPLDLGALGLEPGTYTVMVLLDVGESVPETDEGNNSARTTLVVTGAKEQAAGTVAPDHRRLSRYSPSLARSILVDAGSGEESAWREPLEAGYHPGHGSTHVLLRFPHPARVPGFDTRGRKTLLKLEVEQVGDPFSGLGPLEVRVRTLSTTGHLCPDAGEMTFPVKELARDRIIDLTGRVPLAPEAQGRIACQNLLEVVLSFPDPAEGRASAGNLLRLREQDCWIEVRER